MCQGFFQLFAQGGWGVGKETLYAMFRLLQSGTKCLSDEECSSQICLLINRPEAQPSAVVQHILNVVNIQKYQDLNTLKLLRMGRHRDIMQ